MGKHQGHQIWQHSWQLHNKENSNISNEAMWFEDTNISSNINELYIWRKMEMTSTNMSAHECSCYLPTILTKWPHWNKQVRHYCSNCSCNCHENAEGKSRSLIWKKKKKKKNRENEEKKVLTSIFDWNVIIKITLCCWSFSEMSDPLQ